MSKQHQLLQGARTVCSMSGFDSSRIGPSRRGPAYTTSSRRVRVNAAAVNCQPASILVLVTDQEFMNTKREHISIILAA